MKKLIGYLGDYRRFRASGFDTVRGLIDKANEPPPPIRLTKVKAGEVIERVEIGVHSFINTDPMDVKVTIREEQQ